MLPPASEGRTSKKQLLRGFQRGSAALESGVCVLLVSVNKALILIKAPKAFLTSTRVCGTRSGAGLAYRLPVFLIACVTDFVLLRGCRETSSCMFGSPCGCPSLIFLDFITKEAKASYKTGDTGLSGRQGFSWRERENKGLCRAHMQVSSTTEKVQQDV